MHTTDRTCPPAAPRDLPREVSGGEVRLMGLLAVLVRLLAMWALGSTARPTHDGVWRWGTETASLAHALYRGDGFGDVFGAGTGPSGWLTPAYPALLAACMRLGGGVTEIAALAIYTLHAVASAATCYLVVAFGRALGLPRAGRWAAWTWVFYPAAVWHAAHTVWDTTFITTALLAWLVLAVRSGPAPGPRRAAWLGCAFGAVLMINPAPVALAPGILLYLGQGLRARRALTRAAVFLGTTAAVCAPWVVRNAVVLGSPGLRTNFGVELHVGNNDQAVGRPVDAFHPSRSAAEMTRYRELGEVSYAAAAMQRGLAWIREHPASFAVLTLHRIQLFWLGQPPGRDPRAAVVGDAGQDPRSWIKWPFHCLTGVGALLAVIAFERRKPAGQLLRSMILLFPLPYYVTHVSERYRMPLDPVLVFLCVWAVLAVVESARRRTAAPRSRPG